MMKKAARLATFLLLLVIAFVTLSPIGLRPETGYPDLERAFAYFLLGVTLAVGFPRHRMQAIAGVVVVAAILEALQLVDPGRHGRFDDMIVKAAGGAIGVLLVAAVLAGLERLRTS